MAVKNEQMEIVDLDALLSQPDAFQGVGYAMIKVTKGDKTLVVRIPIQSVPQDHIEKLRKGSPKPPVEQIMVDPTSDIGQQLKLSKRGPVKVPNLGDEGYVRAVEEFNALFLREIVGRGVRSENLTVNGEKAITPEQKFAALQERGLSAAQMTDIMNDVLSLTSWSEEERENFSRLSSA